MSRRSGIRSLYAGSDRCDDAPSRASMRTHSAILGKFAGYDMIILGLLSGCLLNPDAYEQRKAELTDLDGDSYALVDDCDDADAAVFPGAAERCDGVDQDCDGLIDEDAEDGAAWYPDADGDGYGAAAPAVSACEAPDGTVSSATDCDDDDASAYPGGAEIAYDGADQDCNGSDLDDVDGDGWSAASVGGEDCDDGDDTVFPGAEETWANGVTDNDCDGEIEAVQLDYGGEAWVGESPGGQAGRRVSELGDVTDDGLADYLVGAVYESSEFPSGGAVYLVQGGVSQGDLGMANTIVAGGASWLMPAALDGGPDVDGDGVVDFVATAAGYNDFTGAAFIVSGATFGRSGSLMLPDAAMSSIVGDQVGDLAGSNAVFLGDVVGDGGEYLGVSSVFADAPGKQDAGQVSLFDARDAGAQMMSDGLFQISGGYEGAGIGNVLGAAGDVNGDGVADYLISVSYGDIAYVLPGGMDSPSVPEDAIFRLSGTTENLPTTAEMVGDINGDGKCDLAATVDLNEVRIFTNIAASSSVTIEEQSATIELPAGALLYDILDLGDLDGDGRSETYLPMQWCPDLASSCAVVIWGDQLGFRDIVATSAANLRTVSLRSEGRFGYRVAMTQDVDGDGGGDIIVGGYTDKQAGTDAGGVLTIPVPR